MTTKRLGIGVIGPGIIGQVHMDSIRRLPEVDLVAVAASSMEKAEKIGRDWNVPCVYGNYRELLQDDRVDVVHIATRNRSHYQIVLDALSAGKHIICEKPLGTRVEETAEMLKQAHASGLVHSVCYNNRFYPLIHHLRGLVAKGELGKVHTIRGSYFQDWLSLDTDYDWRVDPVESGPSRAISDIGTHLLDLMHFASGTNIVSVMADLSTILSERQRSVGHGVDSEPGSGSKVSVQTEDYAAVLLHFEGQAKGCLMVSQVAPGYKNSLVLEISGTIASAIWKSEHPNELWVGYRDQPNQLMISQHNLLLPEARVIGGYVWGLGDPFDNYFRAVYREVSSQKTFRSDRVSFATFTDGHRDVAIMEAIMASNRTRVWTNLTGV